MCFFWYLGILIHVNQVISTLQNLIFIFKYEFLYTAYADDTTFFLKDGNCIIELMNELNTFSNFSGLKPNKTKCETAGIGVLNGVQVALCGMKCVNLITKL